MFDIIIDKSCARQNKEWYLCESVELYRHTPICVHVVHKYIFTFYVVGSKIFRPDTQKPRRGIYSAIYGEVNVSVEKCVEIKGDYVKKIAKLFYFCHLKKLVRPETFGPYL